MTTIQLTLTQQAILAYAIEHTGGKIDWFPDNIKGGVRTKVLEGLFNKALVTRDNNDWFVSAEGYYDAMGRERPVPAPLVTDPELDAAVMAIEKKAQADTKKPHTRDNSKQAEVIRMLQRPEGATIVQICGATGWQAHTVRGTFAGAFKKKLGLTIVSEKHEGGQRIYRIA